MTIHSPRKLSTAGASDDHPPRWLTRDHPLWEKSNPNPLEVTYEVTTPLEARKVFLVLDRYRLQAIARELLNERGHHRIDVCKRVLAPREGAVRLGIAKGRASYAGLMVCGSPWVCAVCADRISRERSRQIEEGMKRHFEGGGTILHVPLTFPHRAHEPLSSLMEKLGEARRVMANRPSWHRFKGVVGLIGYIRALEVTYGENGWHPHLHDAWFLSKRFTNQSMVSVKKMVLDMWQNACMTVGLQKPNYENGVKVIPVKDPNSYIAKWGIQAEMTRSHMKRGRGGNYSPYDLLRAVHEGEEHLAPKFLEFADAFHGKTQIRWSRGLRKLYLLGEERPNEEIAASVEDGWSFLMFIAPSQWKVILEKEKRWQILKIAESEGEEGVRNYIRELCGLREPGVD